MEINQEPYQLELKIKGNETSLKQVFDENINNYWTRVFKGHSPKEPPSYSVFRKQMNIEAEYFDEFQGKSLHILLLKCEGYKFPRNPKAHFLELFCNTHFYGPLVISMNMNQPPFHLSNFKQEYITQIYSINNAEKRQYPPPFIPTNSQKKNKSMPFYVANEQKKGDFSEDLIRLKTEMQSDLFYMYKYKTAYCPQKNVKHDWANCFYAHRPSDYRRPPDQYIYSPDDCKNQTQDSEDCHLGFKCNYSHSTYERLYHPLKYKTNPCDQSFKSKRKHCKRGSVCAFYHEKPQKRHPEIDPQINQFYKIQNCKPHQYHISQSPPIDSVYPQINVYFGMIGQQMSPVVLSSNLSYSPQDREADLYTLQYYDQQQNFYGSPQNSNYQTQQFTKFSPQSQTSQSIGSNELQERRYSFNAQNNMISNFERLQINNNIKQHQSIGEQNMINSPQLQQQFLQQRYDKNSKNESPQNSQVSSLNLSNPTNITQGYLANTKTKDNQDNNSFKNNVNPESFSMNFFEIFK